MEVGRKKRYVPAKVALAIDPMKADTYRQLSTTCASLGQSADSNAAAAVEDALRAFQSQDWTQAASLTNKASAVTELPYPAAWYINAVAYSAVGNLVEASHSASQLRRYVASARPSSATRALRKYLATLDLRLGTQSPK